MHVLNFFHNCLKSVKFETGVILKIRPITVQNNAWRDIIFLVCSINYVWDFCDGETFLSLYEQYRHSLILRVVVLFLFYDGITGK